MQIAPRKNTRAEQARINGAKSRGPQTPRGQERARTAPLKNGIYSSPVTLRATVDTKKFAELRAEYHEIWAPQNRYLADKVDDLVSYRWKIDRLREVSNEYFTRIFSMVFADDVSKTTAAEIAASEKGSVIDRFDTRIGRYQLELSRVERDVLRAIKNIPRNPETRIPLETNEAQTQRTRETQAVRPVLWAEQVFEYALDNYQAEILNCAEPLTVCSAARYSGKTTALALRALHESVHNPAAKIACLSPAGALLIKVKSLAEKAGYDIANVSGQLSGDATLVLIDDAADLLQKPEIGPNARIILAATPKGAGGYFHDQWRNPDAFRIHAPVDACQVVNPVLLRHARSRLHIAAFQQEFECHFLQKAQPRCRILPLPE
jgi:hypothetical protein